MADPDVFAILAPGYGYEGEHAKTALGQHYNAARYRGQTQGPVLTEPVNDSRESTLGLTPPCIQETDGCLVLRFSDSTINPANGLVFGKDERSSDIMIQCPGVRGVSRRHFSIVAKENGSWYLEDFYSRFGTAVSYDGRGALHRRKRERWILAHPPSEEKHWDELLVYAGNVAFRINFINQQAGHPTYVANLKAFVSTCREALPTLDVLGLESHDTTAAPSHIVSPDRSRQPIYIDYEEVGQGAFAKVLKVMSCRNGVFYAKKKFSRPIGRIHHNGRKRVWDSEAWFDNKRKEADIMRRSVHTSVMPLIDVIEETDSFSIVMPLYIFGSLQDYRPSNGAYAYESVFLQILQVLDWLHSRGVVHRDIKPENFLVEHEEPLKIVVADFGLSKVSIDQLLTTFCGTLLYCAPEVFPGNSRGYGPKADMWSLGVMMLNLLVGLPESPFLPCHDHGDLREWVDVWSERLHAELHKSTVNDDHKLLTEILLEIVKVDPEQRLSAAECLQKGLETGLFSKDSQNQIILLRAKATHPPLSDSSIAESTEGLTGRRTSPLHSSQLLRIIATGEPTGISFLDEDSCFAPENGSVDEGAPCSTSPVDSRSTSGPPRRRQKIQNASSHPQSLKGVNSGMAGGPAENESWGSVERRVFEMLA